MKLKLLISYVGTNYCGWQIQEKTKAYTPTIQAELEKAFFRILKTPIRVIGASRTDSGVHADEQVAHCEIPFNPKNINWQRAINTVLPHDIRIKHAVEMDDDFHAQFESCGKIYNYSLWTDVSYVSPRLYPFIWVCGKVDFDLIEKALPFFIGKHDFKSFQNTGTELAHTVRVMEYIKIHNLSDYHYSVEFKGSGFLKQMIRNIIGLLVHVGQGKINYMQVKDIIEAKERTPIYPTAPAQGLTLTKVLYEEA